MNPNNPTSNSPIMPTYEPPHAPEPSDAEPAEDKNLAVDMLRQKIDSIYADEPSAKEEIVEIAEAGKPQSKHQQYMYSLSTSGRSLAEIQTAWHKYYSELPDKEKFEVWEEFYAANDQVAHHPHTEPAPEHKTELPKPIEHAKVIPTVYHAKARRHHPAPKTRSVSEIKQSIINHVQSPRKLKARHHLQSLIFGLGLGSFVMLILLFGFFNERFIAPFITPSRHVTSTPIIVDQNSAAVDPQPKIIIPKINVEIPVVYTEPSTEEKMFQKALESGVVHYATTPNPGEKGNAVIFGHSSNNIFNKGKYKFAFVLLSRLEPGDLFYINRDSKRYAYRVYKKDIVKPTQISVLGATDKVATVTLITCDPPGTSLNRLVVVGEQISPDPSVNTTSTASKPEHQPVLLPSNSPSLWQRLVDWFTGR